MDDEEEEQVEACIEIEAIEPKIELVDAEKLPVPMFLNRSIEEIIVEEQPCMQ